MSGKVVIDIRKEVALLNITNDDNVINKTEFDKLFSIIVGESIVRSGELTAKMIELIKALAELGHATRFHGFGRYDMRDRQGHVGQNLKPKNKINSDSETDTDEDLSIPIRPHKGFTFTASRTYKNRIKYSNEVPLPDPMIVQALPRILGRPVKTKNR